MLVHEKIRKKITVKRVVRKIIIQQLQRNKRRYICKNASGYYFTIAGLMKCMAKFWQSFEIKNLNWIKLHREMQHEKDM